MTRVTVDLSKTGYKFILPQLLAHPHIPGSLSGINPRNIFGKEWWDEQRSAAYKGNNSHCWACGKRASSARLRRRLEAHEAYDMNGMEGTMTFMDVVALCSDCHTFIHSGRMYSDYTMGRFSKKNAKYIIKRGVKLLKEIGLEPYWGTRAIELVLFKKMEHRAAMHKAKSELIGRDRELAKKLIWGPTTWWLVVEGRRWKRVDGWYFAEFDQDGRMIGERHRIPVSW